WLFLLHFSYGFRFRSEFQIPAYWLAASDIAGMSVSCTYFNQSVFAVFFVQRECLPHNERSTAGSEEQADVITYASHIQNHHEDECSEETTGEDEKVLCL